MKYIGQKHQPNASELVAVASGTLANGSKVIVNADGTVSAVAEANGALDPPQPGTSVIYSANSASNTNSTFDSNSNRVVITYQDHGNSRYGTAVVGTVSGTSISFGTPVAYNSVISNDNVPTFDSDSNKVVIAFDDQTNSDYGKAIVGAVNSSNNSIAFGSIVTFESARANLAAIAFDSNVNKVVVLYNDGGNSDALTAVVGDVTASNNSIAFGTPVSLGLVSYTNADISFDSTANKMVVAYKNVGDSNHGAAKVGTITASNNSIAFGAEAKFLAASTTGAKCAYDPDTNKTAIFFRDLSVSPQISKAVVATVNTSNNTLSYGSLTAFTTFSNAISGAVYDTNINKFVVVYTDQSGDITQHVIVGTVNGTSISFGTLSPTSADTTKMTAYIQSACFDSNSNKVVSVFRKTDPNDANSTSTNKGRAVVISTQGLVSNLTAENYIGISDAVYTSGQDATVQLVGSIDDAQSSLTPGQTYFVQTDGSLGTTADDPSVVAGTAIASTKLIVKE